MSEIMAGDNSAPRNAKTTAGCPNCSSQFIKRVRRTTIYERWVSLFYIYPFSCQLCGHEFPLFQPGVRYVRVDEDQRIHQRLRVDLPITLAQDNMTCEGSAIEISMHGCSVRTERPPAIAAVVTVRLTVPNEKEKLTIDAAIVRNSSANRVGLEFLGFEGDERVRLQRFVQSLLSRRFD